MTAFVGRDYIAETKSGTSAQSDLASKGLRISVVRRYSIKSLRQYNFTYFENLLLRRRHIPDQRRAPDTNYCASLIRGGQKVSLKSAPIGVWRLGKQRSRIGSLHDAHLEPCPGRHYSYWKVGWLRRGLGMSEETKRQGIEGIRYDPGICGSSRLEVFPWSDVSRGRDREHQDLDHVDRLWGNGHQNQSSKANEAWKLFWQT